MADIDIGQFSEALNDKSDRDLRNVDNTAGADAVIEYQLPTAENNYTWYRKYASGWVEQGGYESGVNGNKTITVPIEMSDANYVPKATRLSGASTTTNVGVWARQPSSTTQFTVYSTGDTGVVWIVKGMAAS